MAEPSEKIARFLVLFVIGVFILKELGGSSIFEATEHKGKGFYVKIPKGWSRVKQEKDVVYPKGVEFVQFVPAGIDLDNERLEAVVSVYSKKLVNPIWIEDEFPSIVQSLREAGYEVKDKGEIKVDERISSWVVYYDRESDVLNLEFYIVSESNIFYKLQYSASSEKFQENRRYFEEIKDSFKFRFSVI